MNETNLRLWSSHKYRLKLHNLSRRAWLCPKLLRAFTNKMMQYEVQGATPGFLFGPTLTFPTAIFQFVISCPNPETA
jgi:hypothetical protein